MENLILSGWTKLIQFPDWSAEDGLPMIRISMVKTRAFFEVKAFIQYMFESFPSLCKSLGRGETKETCSELECRETFPQIQNCNCMTMEEFYSDEELFSQLDMFCLSENLEVQFKDYADSIEELPTPLMAGYTVCVMLQPLMNAFKEEVRETLPQIMGEFTNVEISADTFRFLYENYIG